MCKLHISNDFTISSVSLKKVFNIAQIRPKSHRTLKNITFLPSDDSQRTIIPRLRFSAATEDFQAFSWNLAINHQSLIDINNILFGYKGFGTTSLVPSDLNTKDFFL